MHASLQYKPFAAQVIAAIAQDCVFQSQQLLDDAVPMWPAPAMDFHHFRQLMDLRMSVRMSVHLCRLHACGASRMLQGCPRG